LSFLKVGFLPSNGIRFFENDLAVGMKLATKELGKFINANHEDLAFVTNATTGISAILRSFPFKHGDEILLLSSTYRKFLPFSPASLLFFPSFLLTLSLLASVKSIIHLVASSSPFQEVSVKVVQVDYTQDNKESIVSKVEKAINPSVTRMLVTDHIVSGTATKLPLEELLPLCKSK
jgi:selenocysteine lyase/cysteine desulfurase